MTADNPLLQPSALPNHAPPFDKISEDHYLPAVEAAIEIARKRIDEIKATTDEASFENTIEALETASEELGIATSVFYNQLSANGNDTLQALVEQIGPLAAGFSSDVALDADLFARVEAVHRKIGGLDLTPEQKTLLDETYKGFVRGGAKLDDKGKARMREISQRLSTLGPTFMNNVKKSAEQFELLIDDEAALSGIPDNARSGAAEAAAEKGEHGKWLFTLDFPSYMPVIQYADRRELREKIWRAFSSRAWKDDYDNGPLILEIVALRDERARLLGYKNHAEYVLEHRMAENPANVLRFLHRLRDSYKPAAQQDLDAIRTFAREQGLDGDLQPWDVAYYAEKLKQKLFDFSSEDLRPYYPLQNVLKGCFEHFSKLFGLRFEINDRYPVWHKDVTAYDLFDDRDGRFIGTLYADFHPRSGKKDGAWMTSYRSQGLYAGKIERPVIAIVCNFTKPTKDTPSLLTHGEVETLFHEMGHAIHGLLSDVTYGSLSGTSVLWDFVELPSQVQENWTFKKETLDMFARHYKTGEPIPQDLFEKLNKARNFMVGWTGLRQVNFALLDMAWHTAEPSSIQDVAAFEDNATSETSLFPRLAGPMSTSFSHLFAGGYAAGYYSYKWAEVLDADTFALFEERGLYDRDTADAYRREILSRGGSEHPSVLYERFRGRAPDPDALLRREGLLGQDKSVA